MSLTGLSTKEILDSIRFDPESKRGSVLDVVQLVTGCTQAHASQDLSRLYASYPEVRTKVCEHQFRGRGQRPTPVAPLPVLIEIAWLCPGKNAKEFRRTGANTLCRALGGDLSLVDEIRARHAEVAGTAEQAALLEGTGVSVAEANGQALVPVSVAMAELDVEERRVRIERMKLENMRMKVEIEFDAAHGAMRLAESVRERAKKETDERQRLFLESHAKNIERLYMPNAQQLALPAPEEEPNANNPLMLTDILQNNGITPNPRRLQVLGVVAARLYREEHGRNPPQHDQDVGGAVRKVNTYFERDRELLERALAEVRPTLEAPSVKKQKK